MKPCNRYLLVVGASVLLAVGCSGPAIRSQSPEEELTQKGTVRLVGEAAVPFNMFPIYVESTGFVTGLNGQGADPAPSPQRAQLLAEMQTRNVRNPQAILASPDTALVIVRAALRPGIQKGDHVDTEIRVPARDETKSLRNGYLMDTNLAEHAQLDGQLRVGDRKARAEGPILVDPSADGKDGAEKLRRGRILGGGVSMVSRPLGLVLKPGNQYAHVSAQVATAVNRRFHRFDSGVKKGVATAKDKKQIVLDVHPRYKDNIDRFVNVVRSIPLKESASQQVARLALLERQLLDPITSASAAIKLEAIGKDSIPALTKGMESKDREVSFYSAEALAYLDQTVAVEPLAKAAKDFPAFRAYALTALSAMDDYSAYQSLETLLHVPSNETRYGAFRALWAMDDRDPLVQGERLGDFSYHVLRTNGPPLVHVTRSFRPEVVLFGVDQRLNTPLTLDAGPHIMINSKNPGEITVSHFTPTGGDQQRTAPATVDAMIRAIVDLGGKYPDVVQALQHAKTSGALSNRFEMDALPKANRRYKREEQESEADVQVGEESESSDIIVANPLPGLFDSGDGKAERKKKAPTKPPAEVKPPEKSLITRFFDKMKWADDDG